MALGRIEAEMQRLGLWDVPVPNEAAIAAGGAFGTATMSFAQWLRWVFVPRVHDLLESGEALPHESHVAAQAAREWGHSPLSVDTGRLETLLSEFDALFG